MFEIVIEVCALLLPVGMAVVFHEMAHGYAALYFGDDTAKKYGRLTLNPIAHIHWFGTIVMPIALYFLTLQAAGRGFLFAFAKPVPVAFDRLRNPKRDMMFVAAAGPASNLVLASGFAVIFHLLEWLAPESLSIFTLMINGAPIPISYSAMNLLFFILFVSVYINVVLALINLIPILPADGGRIVSGLLPNVLAEKFARIEPWGLFLLILLLYYNPLGIINWTIKPLIDILVNLLLWL